MQRYFIANIDAHVGNYPICDERQGGRREPIARCYDGETAERIVRLLNADEAAAADKSRFLTADEWAARNATALPKGTPA